jgi:leucyl aminopeptidase
VPRDGPVEFHWYAAEEGGYLGSQAIVRYKRESGARIGAMMEFVSRLCHGKRDSF